jgi:hypothetical protein
MDEAELELELDMPTPRWGALEVAGTAPGATSLKSITLELCGARRQGMTAVELPLTPGVNCDALAGGKSAVHSVDGHRAAAAVFSFTPAVAAGGYAAGSAGLASSSHLTLTSSAGAAPRSSGASDLPTPSLSAGPYTGLAADDGASPV